MYKPGSGLGSYAWYDRNSGGRPRGVGTKKRNAWAPHDMHGNVFDWCQDWYDEKYYGKSPASDSTGPEDGKFRALRGGSWYCSAYYCRSAYRYWYAPTVVYLSYGGGSSRRYRV